MTIFLVLFLVLIAAWLLALELRHRTLKADSIALGEALAGGARSEARKLLARMRSPAARPSQSNRGRG